MEQTMTMAVPKIANKNHLDKPGNPSTATSSALKLNDRSNGEPLRILSENDWTFWIENGYVIVKNAVPREQALETAQFLWEFEEKDPNNPDTWYAAQSVARILRVTTIDSPLDYFRLEAY
jgi:hypothetical protein